MSKFNLEPDVVRRYEGKKGGDLWVVRCHHCQEEFHNYVKHNQSLFCSTSCWTSYKNLRDNPNLIHGKHWSRKRRFAEEALKKKGVPLDVCEQCNKKIQTSKHIQYHHKDRDPWNNEPDNVEVLCVSCHAKEHYKDREVGEDGRFK